MANTTGKKFGGRQKGTPNRTVSETKEILKAIVNKELDSIPNILKQLDPSERINAIAKLLPYVVPKQRETSIELKENLTPEEKIQRIKELKAKLDQAKLPV